jgi:hypothetical protein
VLAAALDGCTGDYARDAALPPVIHPELVHVPKLEAKALAALLASSAATDTQRAWHETYQQKGNWWQDAGTTIDSRVLRHPATGEVWVSVFVHRDHGCGDPQGSVYGLFHLDGAAELETVYVGNMETVEHIEQLVDVDGDGQLELIGTPWLGLDRVLARPSGEELSHLSVQFLGCPC